MKLKNGMWPVLIAGSLVMGGCGSNAMGADVSQSGGQQDYGATKTMVIDILHSQEGKTALQDVMKDPTFKQQLVVSDADITKAVTASVESKKTQSFLAEQAKDPKFAAALAKAVQPDLISTSKQLMKDPDYQKDMLTLLQSPDFTKSLQTLLQGPQFRQDVMKIMTQALDTPAFRMKFQDSLKAAVAESMKSTGGSSSGGSGGGSGGGSDGASGGSSSSGAKEGGGS